MRSKFNLWIRIGVIFLFVGVMVAGLYLIGQLKVEDSDLNRIDVEEAGSVESPASATDFPKVEKVSNPAVSLEPTKPAASPTTAKPIIESVLHQVPFISQAPSAQWDDDRFQNACEEASMIMAMAWVNGRERITVTEAEAEILALVDYELEHYGQSVDHDAQDTAKIIKGYYDHDQVEVVENIKAEDIINALIEGKLVVVPMNGQKLNNPNFTAPGPLQHMVVVIGYDNDTNEFITNDPGTRNGKSYRYDVKVFEEAIRDYPTGEHELILTEDKNMIVVRKE